MKNIKNFNQFFEDGTACVNASVSGMGDVVSATVGQFAGLPGTDGSGDRSNIGAVSTKQKVGGPSEVSDLRYLKRIRKKRKKRL
jgi:hypothetical protein